MSWIQSDRARESADDPRGKARLSNRESGNSSLVVLRRKFNGELNRSSTANQGPDRGRVPNTECRNEGAIAALQGFQLLGKQVE